MSDQLWHDVKEVGELASGAYYLKKAATDTDPIDSEGRLGGSVYVRSHADYATTVAGQISTVGHFILLPILKLILVPFWIASLAACVGWPIYLAAHNAPTNIMTGQTEPKIAVPIVLLLMLVMFVFWAYVIFWRLTLKPTLNLIAKHGPGITYADGYQGPLGTGETVHTFKYKVTKP